MKFRVLPEGIALLITLLKCWRNLESLFIGTPKGSKRSCPMTKEIQAAAGMPKPLNAMTNYEWMTAFCTVCGELDAIVKKIEMPVINPKLNGRTVKREERKLQVLTKPTMRHSNFGDRCMNVHDGLPPRPRTR